MNETPEIVAAILTGGKSKRMGKDKSALQIDDQTLLERTVDTIKASSITHISVSTNSSLTPRDSLSSVEYIKDVYPNKGPLSGIHSVISNYPSIDILVVPVDLPLLTANTLKTLIHHGSRSNYLLSYEQSIMPLYIPASLNVLGYLKEQLKQCDLNESMQSHNIKQKHLSIRQFVAAFANRQIELEDKSALFNVNTPKEWQKAVLIDKKLK